MTWESQHRVMSVVDAPTTASGLAQAEPGEPLARLHEQIRLQASLLASAAHQLRTPLGAVTGYVGLLASGKPGPLNDAQERILEAVALNCSRLEQTVRDFLNYSALETGTLPMNFAVADLVACLADICEVWLPRFRERGVTLYAPLRAEIPPFSFDFHKVQHAVSNLLENALKVTPPDGSVWLTVEPHVWDRRIRPNQSFREERRRQDALGVNAVRVTVCDTGPGIRTEHHQEIFEESVRLARSGTPVAGVGLGLAIARRLVTAHGGRIWVESTVGAGSKFCFLLPLSR